MSIIQHHRTWPAALVAALACIVSSSTGTVFAAGATGLPVIVRPCDVAGNQLDGPGYFVVTAASGSTTQLYALLGNKSHEKAVVSIVPVDGATGIYGGVTARLASQPRQLVGSWIHLSASKVMLDPDKGQVVSFTLQVPKHTKPGQYVGALTAFVPARDTRRGTGFAFTVQTRLADDVVVTVPGPQSSGFQSAGVKTQRRTDGTYVIAHIKNTGTMMLKGSGYLWIWLRGQRAAVLARLMSVDTTLPHTTANYPLFLGMHPRPGRYAFKLKLWWNGGHSMENGNMRIWR